MKSLRVPVEAAIVGFRIRFHLIGIRIQHFRLNTDPDPDPDSIRIQVFNDQKLKKIYSWKKIPTFFGSNTTIYLSLGLFKVTEEAFSSQKRTSSTSKEGEEMS
jgi:hypothetical protein